MPKWIGPSHALSNDCTIDLAPYCMGTQIDTIKVICRTQSEAENIQEDKIGKGLPKLHEELTIRRARYKLGTLEILLSKVEEKDYDIWFTLDRGSYKPIKDLVIIPIVEHSADTGRIVLRTKQQSRDQIMNSKENSNNDSFRVIGSRLTDAKSQFAKPFFQKHSKHAPEGRQIVKKVCFVNKVDIITNQLVEIDLD